MNNKTKNLAIGALVIALVAGGAYYMTRSTKTALSPVAAAGAVKESDSANEPAETEEAPAKVEAQVGNKNSSTGNETKSESTAKAPTASAEQKGTGFDKMKAITTMDKNGVKVEVMHVGQGDAVSKSGQMVAVHYIGKFTDGKVFDTSLKNGKDSEPFVFTLGAGQVIKGWDIGVEGMKLGEARRLTIPSELAYGEKGAPGAIPPNSTLIFDVQLMGMK